MGSAPQPALEPVRTGPPAPFSSLPPLQQLHASPEPVFPPGPAAPHQGVRQLRSLASPPARSRPSPGNLVTVTAHPPLAGDPRGAVAFVFDQAMVDARRPTTAPQDQLRISPPAPGRLQWLGDRTLVFVPRDRLRHATAYTVILRPPLTARSGARLTKEAFTGFTTIAPSLVASTPTHTAREVDVQPVFHLRFNQPMDPEVVRRALRLVGPGASDLVRADTRAHRPPGEVRLRPRNALWPSTSYQLLVPRGLRGAEGTLGSLAAARIQFTTAGPLRLLTARCPKGPCHPGDVLRLETVGSPGPVCALLRVVPPPEDLRCRVRGGRVLLNGSFKAETRYELSLVPDGGVDKRAPAPLQVQFGRRQPPLAFYPNRPLLSLRTGAPFLPVSGARRGRLRVAPVEPALVSTLLTAIADPGALPPFQLTRQQPSGVPLHPSGEGFDLRRLGAGPALLLATLDGPPAPEAGPTHPSPRRTALLQRTGLALAARYGWNAGAALVVRTTDGKPAFRTPLRIRDRAGRTLWQGRTDAQGLAHFPGRRRLRRAGPYTLWAEHGADRSFLVLDGGGEDAIRTPGYLRGQRLPAVERVIGGVFSDRPHYAPGEAVRLFGVLRGQTRLPQGGIGHLSASHGRVAYRVVSETEEEIAAGQVDLGAAGLFRIDLRLPRSAQPGRYTAWLNLPGTRRAYADWVLGSFRVVAPRRRLRLGLTLPTEALMGSRPEVGITLREPSGRPAAGATLRWRLYRQGDAPAPREQTDFHFGRAGGPAVTSAPSDDPEEPSWPEEAVWVAGGRGTTDAQGRLRLRPRLLAPPPMAGTTFELVAEATTLDGRTIRRSATLVARRRRLQLGLLPDTRLVRVGEPLPVWLVSIDGRSHPLGAGQVTVTAHAYTGAQPDAHAAARCRAELSLATGGCRLILPRPGRYLLRAQLPAAAAPAGATPAEVVVYAHAAPGTTTPAPKPRTAPAVELIPGQPWYREGARATLLIRSPVSPATALLTLERDGIAQARVVSIGGPDTLVTLRLGRRLAPNAWVGVTVLAPQGTSPLSPAALSERLRLNIRPAQGRLRVRIGAATSQAHPGGRLPLSLQVTDEDGRPVPASVMLLLQPDTPTPPPDLEACLQRDRGPGIALRTTSAHRASARPRWRENAGPPAGEPSPGEPGNGPGGSSGAPSEPTVGSPPDAALGHFFRGPVRTNADGRLSLTIPLPRQQGQYRLVALAADRNLHSRLGRQVLPLKVTPALGLGLTHPQTLRIGDRAVLVAHLQNHTARPLDVTVLARADELPISSRARHLRLAPGQRGQVTFAARATRVGLARLQVAAIAAQHRAALERRIPVQPSARDHTVRRLGVLSSVAALPLRRPTEPSNTPRHQLWLSNAPVGAGLAALRWLLLRQALTLEAAAARLVALDIAHTHRRTALGNHLPDSLARRTLCRRAMRQIMDLELPRGGLRRYDGGPPAQAPGLAFALLALRRAKAARCFPPGPLVTALTGRLHAIAADPGAEPHHRATALAALHRHRSLVPGRLVRAVLRHWRRLPLVERGSLLPLISEPGQRRRLTEAVDRQLAAGEPAPRGPRAELTARRLLAELTVRPRLPEVRTWLTKLLALGRTGRWGSVRATVWALLALSRAEPFLVRHRPAVGARAWLDGRHWGGRTLRGATLDLVQLSTGQRADLDPRTLLLQARGSTPVYFLATRVVRRTAPTMPQAPASLSVALIPAGGRATLPPGPPLPLRVGDNAIGRVTLVTTRSIPSTVLRVPIPAGCDVVDPGHPRPSQDPPRRFPPPPVLDATVRDGVLRLHLADLPPGIHEHRLVIQATSAGRFGCAPATLRQGQDERLLTRAAHCRPLRIRPRTP